MSEKVLATISAADFIGRSAALGALRRHASGASKSNGLLLAHAPVLGASELLKQTFDRLFHEQTGAIPIYFAVRASDETTRNCAARFLTTVLAQTIAFRRRDAKILDFAPNVAELAELAEIAAPDDAFWIERLVANCQIDEELNDEAAFIRRCLAAPLRAAAHKANAFVMFDDLHEIAHLKGDFHFLEELKRIYASSDRSFVFGGRRRFLLTAAQTGNARLDDAEILHLEPLDFSDAGILAENSAENLGVKINELSRDLIARKLDGNPAFTRFIMQAAAANKTDLESFQAVEKIYADEIFGGRIGKFYDAVFQKIASASETQKKLVGLLHNALKVDQEKVSVESWRGAFNLNDAEFSRLMSLLNWHEIIRLSSGFVEPMRENEVLSDYLTARFRLENAAENRALVVGETLAQFLKRAPQLMAKFYRRRSAIGLRELLAVFDFQETPLALLDYSAFKEILKGAETAEIFERLQSPDAEKILLPQIIYTAHTVALYPPIEQVAEQTRTAVALGFEERGYTDADETVWLAAEIESKLEASKETAEFWCDRLEMVALSCNFQKYKLWLVAPEGFTPEAAEVLRQRNAFGSSKSQVELLVKFLKAEKVVGEKQTAHEYEIVVPMGDDSELIAAHTVEEIAKRYSFKPKAINQIKTALIEACINAAEHSLSFDRKIYQKLAVDAEKIVITVSNRGLRFSGTPAPATAPAEGRRGWGLKLMESLMDEVKFERVDDGTRISMTKYLK